MSFSPPCRTSCERRSTRYRGGRRCCSTKIDQPEDRGRGLETIERNVRAQAQIVNDLLDMSRIISGKIHLEVQPMQLHEVIDSAIEAIRQSAEAKRIRVHKLLDSSIGWVRGDPNRLQQVLWNLLSNAVKFTPARRQDPGRAGARQLPRRDRGRGHRRRHSRPSSCLTSSTVFARPMRRLRAATAGLGLGLSIVKTLVELHGGSVRVKSAGENQGSTFIVALPDLARPGGGHRRERKAAAAATDPLETIELPRLDGARY